MSRKKKKYEPYCTRNKETKDTPPIAAVKAATRYSVVCNLGAGALALVIALGSLGGGVGCWRLKGPGYS